MALIIFCGISCTGKSSLANRLGRELSIPVFSIDVIKGFFIKTDLANNGWGNVRGKGYQLLFDLTDQHLRLNQTVIVEGIFARAEFRVQFSKLAINHQTKFHVFECICSDRELHQKRVISRKRNIEGLPEINWEFVETIKSKYVKWESKSLTIDSVNDFDKNYQLIKNYLFDKHVSL